MPQGGLRIGAFAGAPIIIDSSILFLAAFFLGTAALDHGVDALPGVLVMLAGLMIVVLLHEFGHAGMAAAFKLKSHAIVLTFFGGYVAFAGRVEKRWQEMAVSAAGPVANLLTFAALYLAGSVLEPLAQQNPMLFYFFDNIAFFSLALGVFNLLPGYPLDGGSILRAGLSYAMSENRARLFTAITGIIVALALLAVAAWQGWVWSIIVGGFLALNAWGELNRARDALKAEAQSSTTSNA